MAHTSHPVNSGILYGGIVFYVKDLPKCGGEDVNMQNHKTVNLAPVVWNWK